MNIASYLDGFTAKCAEHGIGRQDALRAAGPIVKRAYTPLDVRNQSLDKMQQELQAEGDAAGFSDFLPRDFRPGSTRRPGNRFTRWLTGLVHGRKGYGFADAYRAKYDAAREQAIARRNEWLRTLPREQQIAFWEAAKKKMQAYNEERAKSRAGGAWNMIQGQLAEKAEKDKAEKDKAPQPAPKNEWLHGEALRQAVLRGDEPIPRWIENHNWDAKTGLYTRTDGQPLDRYASWWNERINTP